MAGALRGCGPEVWRNRLQGLSFLQQVRAHRRRSCGVLRGALETQSRACPWKRREVGRTETVCRWSGWCLPTGSAG